jgi:hypothetical protein
LRKGEEKQENNFSGRSRNRSLDKSKRQTKLYNRLKGQDLEVQMEVSYQVNKIKVWFQYRVLTQPE